jgi:hypothetical protein
MTYIRLKLGSTQLIFMRKLEGEVLTTLSALKDHITGSVIA